MHPADVYDAAFAPLISVQRRSEETSKASTGGDQDWMAESLTSISDHERNINLCVAPSGFDFPGAGSEEI